MLHALRREVGDGPFFAILRQWVATYSGRSATTEDFVATASSVAGRDLGPFLHQLPVQPRPLDRPMMRPEPRQDARRPPRAGLGGVGGGGEAQAGVDPDPAQRLGLPPPAALVHPGQPHERRVGAGDEMGQRAPGQVRRRHPVAHVAAAPRQARVPVVADRRRPVPRHAEGAAPPVGDGRRRPGCGNQPARARVIDAKTRSSRSYSGWRPRGEVVRRAPAADGDAPVGGALGVDDEMAAVGDGLALGPARPSPRSSSGSGSVATISE